MKGNSIFNIPTTWNFNDSEFFEILKDSKNIKIERIISKGNVTTNFEWYNQEKDEWVILIQGEAKIEYPNQTIIALSAGEHLFIPKNTLHRVIETSSNPECIWIAVHADFK